MTFRLDIAGLLTSAAAALAAGCDCHTAAVTPGATVMQLTSDPKGHWLHNTQCFSPDDRWIVYDHRRDDTMIAGTGTIEKVNVETGEKAVMYRTRNQTQHGPGVGAATYSPKADRVLFIHGVRNCDAARPYGFRRRTGVAVDDANRGVPIFVDARDVTWPFTPGALRGGTHGHTWSGDGRWISFTYQDAVLGDLEKTAGREDLDLRTVGVSAPIRPVKVDRDPEGENNDGEMFSVLVAKVVSKAEWGSDEIERAFSDSWVGTNGYRRPDGTRRRRAIAFQGHVRDGKGRKLSEVFLVDVPDRIDVPGGDGPLEGTPTSRPMPPKGTVQRRLTYTADRKHPGLQGPRHWLRSSPDGARIAFLAKDDEGVVQIFFVSPCGGEPVQLTRNKWSVQTSFNWSPDGRFIAHGMDNSIFITEVGEGEAFGRPTRMTPQTSDDSRPLGAIWSNDGSMIAYNRYVRSGRQAYPQIFLLKLKKD